MITLLLRWAGVLLFYLSLKELWPRHPGYLRWLGALVLVYPGFFMQSISTALQRHFTAYFLFMLSLYLDGAGGEAPPPRALAFPPFLACGLYSDLYN